MNQDQVIARAPGRTLSPSWPLTVLFVFIPLWWILGVWLFLFILLAIPMAVYLLRQREIEMPQGYGLWLILVVWVLLGVLVLQVDAPGTVPGANMNRYLVFGFRFTWYLSATIVALYVLNTRHVLSSEKIVKALGWMFIMFLCGGLLGMFFPEFQMQSAIQAVLPRSIADVGFVRDLTIVRTAQIQDVLGEPQARPSAPLTYTNEWGFNTALTFPFFAVSWWTRGRRWRVGMLAVVPAFLFVVISSLNRGMWIAIISSIVLAVVLAAIRGDFRFLGVGVGIALAVAVTLVFTPLGALITGRLENGRSDGVRTNLALTAWETVARGSPFLGFGTTRNLVGTFASIAGGATDACPACEPPPIGTHGQLWEVAFAAGFVGLALYLAFFASQFILGLHVRTPSAMAALACLFVLLVSSPFYSAVGLQLYVVGIAVGLLARESTLPLPTLQAAISPVIRHATLLVGLALCGAGLGIAYNAVVGAPVAATQRVLVPATELVPVPGVRLSTLDSEASIARSRPVVEAVATSLDTSYEKAEAALRIGAEPNTRVLRITVDSQGGDEASRAVEAAVAAFVAEREELLSDRNDAVRDRFGRHQEELAGIYAETWPDAVDFQSKNLWATMSHIRQKAAEAMNVVENVDDAAVARVLSLPTLAPAGDHQTVRAASGFGLGVLAGFAIVFLFDRKFYRVGNRVLSRAGVPLPLVATSSISGSEGLEGVVRGYVPLAGILADERSPQAMRLAANIDGFLATDDRGGSRVLLVLDANSRAESARRLFRRARRIGLDPMGVILSDRPTRSRSRRNRTNVGAGEQK